MLGNDIEKVYNGARLNRNYSGPVYTFDLDKTYLATEFEHLTKLVKIPFEKAGDKRNVPGTAALVRELKSKYDAPLFFISGSPKGMRDVISEKLKLDEVGFDGLLLKDFGEAIRKLKWKNIIDKIGYKLAALLYGRITFPPNAYEIIFGDDSEYDATIYSLYADIVSGRFEDFEVLTILKRWKVNKQEFELIRSYLTRLKKIQSENSFEVQKIFIHLETKTSPLDHMSLSDKVTPTRNYFQTALLLYKNDLITRQGLFRVILELVRKYKFPIAEFIYSIQDLFSRGLVDRKEGRKIVDIIAKGNPLALPLQILNEVKNEASRILDTVTQAPGIFKNKPSSFFQSFRKEKSKEAFDDFDFLGRYISHTPKRNV